MWSCMWSCMGNVSVSSCWCCMIVSCVHLVAVLNVAFYMTFSLLMLVEDARGDHMEEAYSRTGLITALYVAMSVSCLFYPVVVSVCVRVVRCWVCSMWVSRVRKDPEPLGALPWVFIFRSRLLLYSAASGENRVQVVLSGFSVRLLCFVQANALCRYDCMYLFAAPMRVNVMVTWTGALGGDSLQCGGRITLPIKNDLLKI